MGHKIAYKSTESILFLCFDIITSGPPTKTPRAETVVEAEKPRSTGRGRPSKTSRKQTLSPQEMMQDPEDESQEEKQNERHTKGKL